MYSKLYLAPVYLQTVLCAVDKPGVIGEAYDVGIDFVGAISSYTKLQPGPQVNMVDHKVPIIHNNSLPTILSELDTELRIFSQFYYVDKLRRVSQLVKCVAPRPCRVNIDHPVRSHIEVLGGSGLPIDHWTVLLQPILAEYPLGAGVTPNLTYNIVDSGLFFVWFKPISLVIDTYVYRNNVQQGRVTVKLPLLTYNHDRLINGFFGLISYTLSD